MLDHLTGRVARVAAQAAVLTAVVGGTVAYAHSGKAVILVLDGTATSVQANADDVRGLLADEGVTVSKRDLVAPALDTPLVEGQQVVVRFARPLQLTVDGVPRTYWTTELTVDAALRSLNIRGQEARVSVSRSQPLGRSGLDVVVSNPKDVTVAADGRTRQVRTTAPTIAELLREQSLTMRTSDQLSALPGSPVVNGQVVALTRVDHRRVLVTESVAPPVVRRPDATLERGRQKVINKGFAGSRSATYAVTLANGKEAGRTLVSSAVLKAPVTRVVQVGTKRVASTGAAGGSVAGADRLNWPALARCESGGNPKAVNPAGYYGLYQFSPATWRAVGGSGMPHHAPPSEQLYRAKLLYKKAGAGQWGCGQHLYD